MSSAINEAKPNAGAALTVDVRTNFSEAKDEINQLMKISEDSVTATGTANAIAAVYSPVSTLTDGELYGFTAASDNTATTTFSPNTLGPYTIKMGGAALGGGEIQKGKYYIVKYIHTGTTFELITPSMEGLALGDQIVGLNISHSSNIVSVTAGYCVDVTRSKIMRSTSTFAKDMDSVFALGTGNGGFPQGVNSGSPDTDTSYHYFMICNEAGIVDYGWDNNIAATNLLTDAQALDSTFVYYRRLFSHRTKAGDSNIKVFTQSNYNPEEFLWDTGIRDVSTSSAGTSQITKALTLPTGVSVGAIIYAKIVTTVAGNFRVYPLTLTDSALSGDVRSLGTSSGNLLGNGQFVVDTDTSGQIAYKCDDATANIQLMVQGWIDKRIIP